MKLPPEQEAIRRKCFHPSGKFIEFPEEELESSIPERFERIVRLYPDHIAVKRSERAITYDELNRAANRMARRILAQRDPKPEPVALFLEPGISLIVASLAVLKAGKISLFVNPLSQPERIAHILSDSGASTLITNITHHAKIQDWPDTQRTLINMDEPDGQVSDLNLGISIAPGGYAEISYTSGSTGQAKGVLKSHRSGLRMVMDYTNACHICAEDRSAVFGRGPVGKHAFSALLTGAAFHFVELRDKQLLRLAEWLNQESITIFSTLPTALRHLASNLPEGGFFPSLRLLRLSGEPLLKSDVELYQKHFSPGAKLVNTYAAKETGDVCFYFIDEHSALTANRVPVGYAAASVKIALVDELGYDVGFDRPGEIVVQSPFLPPGYWPSGGNLAESPAILSHESGASVWHTGDIGQLSPDGCLMHLGRKDSVIKIRSFRVNMGEIEATLARHPAVEQAAVVSTEHVSGDTRLVAYYILKSDKNITTTALRKFLGDRLPEYMVPSSFVRVDTFPLTATGKVARSALPQPGNRRPNLESPYVAPRTPIESALERIWSDVLCLEQAGIHDDFFELGGHSLAATRIVSRVIQDFQLEIPLQSLFESPTIAAMAAAITMHQGKRLDERTLTALLDELDSMSEADARQRTSEQGQKNSED